MKTDQLSIMSDLRKGLQDGEVSLHYQPKFNLETGEIKSVEALTRWNSKERGFVPPDHFIPIAEKTGEIRHLTAWVLEEAVKQIAAWRRQGVQLCVGINISSNDVMNRSLPSEIAELLSRYHVSPRMLYMEVTESDVLADMDRALGVMRDLESMGIYIAIDDYGVGYSSLTYLRRLPVRELKIDKSFILRLATNVEDNILVRSTIDLGHNLGLKVTAEGVEDRQSFDLLEGYGCDYLQGYYISRPVPADQIPIILRARSCVPA